MCYIRSGKCQEIDLLQLHGFQPVSGSSWHMRFALKGHQVKRTPLAALLTVFPRETRLHACGLQGEVTLQVLFWIFRWKFVLTSV